MSNLHRCWLLLCHMAITLPWMKSPIKLLHDCKYLCASFKSSTSGILLSLTWRSSHFYGPHLRIPGSIEVEISTIITIISSLDKCLISIDKTKHSTCEIRVVSSSRTLLRLIFNIWSFPSAGTRYTTAPMPLQEFKVNGNKLQKLSFKLRRNWKHLSLVLEDGLIGCLFKPPCH